MRELLSGRRRVVTSPRALSRRPAAPRRWRRCRRPRRSAPHADVHRARRAASTASRPARASCDGSRTRRRRRRRRRRTTATMGSPTRTAPADDDDDADADADAKLITDASLKLLRERMDAIETREASMDIVRLLVLDASGAFYTLVPIRPRSRGERRFLRNFPGASLRSSLGFNPHHRRLSTPPDAFELHPDVRSYGTALSARAGPPARLPRGRRPAPIAERRDVPRRGRQGGRYVRDARASAVERADTPERRRGRRPRDFRCALYAGSHTTASAR